MKKTLKSIIAIILAVVMVCSLAGCSSKATWSAKYNDETLSIGTYIYFLAYASSEASYLVENSEKSVLSQTVEGKPAETWIKERAQHYVNYLFAIDKMAKDRGISLTDEQKENAKVSAKSLYTQMENLLKKYGVAESSFERVVIEEMLTEEIFEAIYADDGEIGNDDKVLGNKYEETYMAYEYAIIMLSTQDAEGKTTFLKDEALAKGIEEILGWVEDYNSGKITKEDFIKKYEASPYFHSEELEDGEKYELIKSVDLKENLANYSENIGKTEVGKACVDDFSNSGYVQVSFITDIKDETAEALKDESTRHTLIHACYQEEFEKKVEEVIKEIKVEYNTEEIDKINLKKFF